MLIQTLLVLDLITCLLGSERATTAEAAGLTAAAREAR